MNAIHTTRMSLSPPSLPPPPLSSSLSLPSLSEGFLSSQMIFPQVAEWRTLSTYKSIFEINRGNYVEGALGTGLLLWQNLYV